MYKAKLRDTGVVVAIKVQRPGVLEGISRDLFLLRIGAQMLQHVPIVQSDMVGLIDTWALRFFDELDYVQEVRSYVYSLLFVFTSTFPIMIKMCNLNQINYVEESSHITIFQQSSVHLYFVQIQVVPSFNNSFSV